MHNPDSVQKKTRRTKFFEVLWYKGSFNLDQKTIKSNDSKKMDFDVPADHKVKL